MLKENIKNAVDFLCNREKLSFDWDFCQGNNNLCEFINFEDKIIPILHWRYMEKFRAIKVIIPELGELSSLKGYYFTNRNVNLKQAMFRELDLAEHWLDSEIDYVAAFINGPCANITTRHKNDTVALSEVSATLPNESVPQYKHEIYTTSGQVCDKAVDMFLVPEFVYLYENDKDPVCFSDIDYMLFGLSQDELDMAYFIFAILKKRFSLDAIIESHKRLSVAVEACFKSAEQYKKIKVGVQD